MRGSRALGIYGPAIGLALLVAGGIWFLGRNPVTGPEAGAVGLPERQFGGSVSAVAVEGDRAWLGTGNRLQAVDISDRALPQPLGQSAALPEAIRSVAVAGDIVFAAAGLSGLAIFDGADPGEPRMIGRIETPWATNDVELDGDLAYLADGNRGLRIFDVADPAEPRELGRLDTPGDALGIAIVRSEDGSAGADDAGTTPTVLVYVADWGTGVRIVDASDPGAPREIAWIDTPGVAADVAAAGDLLLVADRDEGLRVIDVSTPTEPRERAALALDGVAERVVLAGDRAYVAAQEGGALAVDLSDPDNPALLGGLEDATVAVDVAVLDGESDAQDESHGETVFFADVGTRVAPAIDSRADLWARMHIWGVEGAPKVAAGLAGMHVAASSAAGLEPVGMYFSPSLIEGGDVVADASIMYLADGLAGVLVVDVADPAAPELLGSLDLPGATHDVKVIGERAMVAAGEAGFVLLDLSDPRDPRTIATLDTPGEALGIALFEGLVYIADGPGGLRVIDPDGPTEIGAFDTPGNSWDVAVGGGHAYVSDRPGGLRIYDVADPARPREVAVRYENTADILDVALVGDRAWIAGGLTGVRLLDVSDPTEPVEMGMLALEDRAIGVIQEGERVFVAAGQAGLRELRVSGDGRPVEVAGWSMPGQAERLLRFGDRLYVAAEMGGLQIVPLER